MEPWSCLILKYLGTEICQVVIFLFFQVCSGTVFYVWVHVIGGIVLWFIICYLVGRRARNGIDIAIQEVSDGLIVEFIY